MSGKPSQKLVPARFITPMKALGIDVIPVGTWQCEIKFDGFRAVAVLNNGTVELRSRNQNLLNGDFPDVVDALKRVRCRNAVIDGEIVALDDEGRSRFQLLQNRGNGLKSAPVVYYAFDIMHRDGVSLIHLPLLKRRMILRVLLGQAEGHVQQSPPFDVQPARLFAAAKEKHLEGIVAKRPDSPYEPGRRSGAWLKCKVVAEQEFVVGGFSEPQRSREYFGAILVGYYRHKKLIYAGKVGSGFKRTDLAALHRMFARARAQACPFDNLPMESKPRHGTGMTAAEMRNVTWLRPTLVAQVKYAEWTGDGLLRQPVFLGLRKDKSPRRVYREAAPANPRRTEA